MSVQVRVPYRLREMADADTEWQQRLPAWILDRWPEARLHRVLCFIDEHQPLRTSDGYHCIYCGTSLVERTVFTHESSDWDMLFRVVEPDEEDDETDTTLAEAQNTWADAEPAEVQRHPPDPVYEEE